MKKLIVLCLLSIALIVGFKANYAFAFLGGAPCNFGVANCGNNGPMVGCCVPDVEAYRTSDGPPFTVVMSNPEPFVGCAPYFENDPRSGLCEKPTAITCGGAPIDQVCN
jgi:hypothetical protein